MCLLVLFQWLFLDQISSEIKQKSKYKVDFHFLFISIEKKIILEKFPNFFSENPGTNRYEIHDEVRKNDKVHNRFMKLFKLNLLYFKYLNYIQN